MCSEYVRVSAQHASVPVSPLNAGSNLTRSHHPHITRRLLSACHRLLTTAASAYVAVCWWRGLWCRAHEALDTVLRSAFVRQQCRTALSPLRLLCTAADRWLLSGVVCRCRCVGWLLCVACTALMSSGWRSVWLWWCEWHVQSPHPRRLPLPPRHVGSLIDSRQRH